jgi:hypothetical protein
VAFGSEWARFVVPTLRQKSEGRRTGGTGSELFALHSLQSGGTLDRVGGFMMKKIVLGRPKRTPKRKGLVIRSGPLFAPMRIKDECFRSLTEQSKALAEKARIEDTLEDLDGKLRCECGATVGARTISMGDWLVPSRHSTFKEPRRLVNPSGKSGYYKR